MLSAVGHRVDGGHVIANILRKSQVLVDFDQFTHRRLHPPHFGEQKDAKQRKHGQKGVLERFAQADGLSGDC